MRVPHVTVVSSVRISPAGIAAARNAALMSFKLEKIGDGSMSIQFVGEYKMRRLNAVYRGKDKVTDVLSFPAEEGFRVTTGGERELGDIFLCLPRLKRQAARYGHSLSTEITILVVHATLHMLGYDHIKDADYKKMDMREKRILKQLT